MQIDSSTHLAATQLFVQSTHSEEGDHHAHSGDEADVVQSAQVFEFNADADDGEATFLTIPTAPASASASVLALSPELLVAADVELPSLSTSTLPPPTAPASSLGSSGLPAPADNAGAATGNATTGENSVAEAEDKEEAPETEKSALAGQDELTEEERQEVDELKARDREVRQHEQAHAAAGGQYTRGGPQYEYTNGPDNKRYATGGEVSIDVSEVPDDPQATIGKMQVVYRAALAPAEPSSADRAIAGEAKQKEAEARRELAEVRRQEGAGDGSGEKAAGTESAGTGSSGEAAAAGKSQGSDVSRESTAGPGPEVEVAGTEGAVQLLDQIV